MTDNELEAKLEADERDAERYRDIGSVGMFWLQNREAILAAIEKAGFRLMSNQHGFWLASHRDQGGGQHG